jgi:hypothetical protein
LDGPTSLYKYFAKDGSLLYIGVSLSAIIRLNQHRWQSSWCDEVRTIKIFKYPSRKLALAAEKAAIIKYKPPYNQQNHPDSMRRHIFRTFGSYEGWRRYADLLERGWTVEAACAELGIKLRHKPRKRREPTLGNNSGLTPSPQTPPTPDA